MALVSVVTVTARPGIFRFGRETLEAQTFKDFEWVVVDALYEQRKDKVAEYMKDSPIKFKHIPDPPKDKKYNLTRANNAGIRASEGELIVWLQDLILMPPDGLQKYWNLYQAHPDSLYSGVDGRFSLISDIFDTSDPIDIIKGHPWSHGRTDYVNLRANAKEIYQTYDPFQFELNYAAFARTVAEDLGGFNEDFDHGFAYDNTEFALRGLFIGKELWVDATNYAEAINHWEIFLLSGDRIKESESFAPDRNQGEQDNLIRYRQYEEAMKAGVAPIYMGNI